MLYCVYNWEHQDNIDESNLIFKSRTRAESVDRYDYLHHCQEAPHLSPAAREISYWGPAYAETHIIA